MCVSLTIRPDNVATGHGTLLSTWRADVTVWCFSCRSLGDGVKDQLLVTIQKTFNYSRSQAQQILLMVTECMKKRALVGP